MDSFVGQHDIVLAIKEEFPVFVTTKVEHEKKEQQHNNYMETAESNLYIKSEEVDIKLEEIDYESINEIKKDYLGFEVEGDFNAIDNLKQEDRDIDENQLDLKNKADIEVEQIAFPSIPVAVLLLNPEGRHTLIQKNTLENITSTFETHPHLSKYTPNQEKRESPKNKNSHKVLLKCDQCSFEAQNISKLHVHIRVHKDPSELDMYECTQCNFKTKYRGSLDNHSILHKDAVDIPIYKCNSCHFESKRKSALIRHIIRFHQNTSGNILKCKQCFYECSDPSLLRSHIRVHKDPSELDMYECTQCNFKTKYSNSLTRHLIRHQDAVGISRYKCNSCDLESKQKGALRRQIRCHQNKSGNVVK